MYVCIHIVKRTIYSIFNADYGVKSENTQRPTAIFNLRIIRHLDGIVDLLERHIQTKNNKE